MYTHLFVTRENAKTLFEAFARKPLEPGEAGAVVRATFEAHFREFNGTYLPKLAASLDTCNASNLLVLKFNDYLPRIPSSLTALNILPTKAAIIRFNNAPTKARAGYYRNPKTGCEAHVERVVPHQQVRNSSSKKSSAPSYAQNIKVTGPSLGAVRDFNTKLSCGFCSRFLVNAFE